MKKKVFLRVRQKGIMFQLGKNKFRSPVDIDVTQYKIDPLIYQMRMNGIDDYEIFTKKVGGVVKPDSKIIILDSKTDDIDRLNSKVEKLENILFDLLNINKEKNGEQNNKSGNSLSKIKKASPNLELKKDIKSEIKIDKKEQNHKKKDDVIVKKTVNVIINKEAKIVKDIKIKSINNKKKKKKIKVINDIKVKPVVYNQIKNKKKKINNDIDILLKHKKVLIEELEDVKDTDIKLEKSDDDKKFEPKPFNKIMIENKPFEISSDVEMLKNFKKK